MASRLSRLKFHFASNTGKEIVVLKDYGDGFRIRQMLLTDIPIVDKWIAEWHLPPNILRTVFVAFGSDGHFVVGEYYGKLVASLVVLPWSESVAFGGHFYVDENYRKSYSFGKRIWQYTMNTLGKPNFALCGETLLSDEEIKQRKGVLTEIFKTYVFELSPVHDVSVTALQPLSWKIMDNKSVPFEKILTFDNESFISKNYPCRKRFLQEWFAIDKGKTYVAVNQNNEVIGYASRLPVQQSPPAHDIGPLYARTSEVAKSLLLRHLADIKGACLQLSVPSVNEAAVKLLYDMGFSKTMHTTRSIVPGTGSHPPMNPNCYAITQDNICGF